MELKEVASGKEAREKEVEGERMTEEEVIKQRNRFGRLVLNEQLCIGPLKYEMRGLESMWRSSIQQRKMSEE